MFALLARAAQQLIDAPLGTCPFYADRAAGICGGIYPVPTPKPSSPGVCMRGPGGPCTFVATADGITGSFTGDHSASDSACSSFDPEFC